MENILVIPTREYFEGITLKQLKEVICKDGFFKLRSEAESDPNYLQIIPYIVVRKGNTVFCYRRLKKGSEERLHSKYSLGIGGHVDHEEDFNPEFSNWVSVENCAYRELTEELDIQGSDQVIIDFFDRIIHDNSNDVGRVHLGIFCVADATAHIVSIREVEKIAGDFVAINKLTGFKEGMETWSQIIFPEVSKL